MIAEVYGWYPDQILDLTVLQYLQWTVWAMETKAADLLKLGLLFGAGETDQCNLKESDIRQLREDPLFGFPHDIKYLSPEQCSDWILYSEKLRRRWAARGKAGDPDILWDTDRMDACLGDDLVAARAAMNNYLWKVYQKALNAGYMLSMEELKQWRRIELLNEQYIKTGNPEILKKMEALSGRGIRG